MKKGFWNYTEEITYRHVLVRVYKKVEDPPLSWQNAFLGEELEALEITYEPDPLTIGPDELVSERQIFYIDNQDGLGILKIQRGGGPDSGSRHFNMTATEVLHELPDNVATHAFSPSRHLEVERRIHEWQRTNYPEEYKRLIALKAAWVEANKKAQQPPR